MSAIAYVSYAAELVGMPRRAAFGRAHEVLYYVGLEEARYRTLGGFSTGMKQRVKLAQALVHGPELVFLDEPTNGLDPPGRDEILGLIEQVSAAGISVVLSSHLLADVERVCDHAIVLADGKLLWEGAIAQMGEGAAPAVELGARGPLAPLTAALEAAGFGVERRGDKLRVEGAGEAEIGQLLAIARGAGVQLRHVVPAALTLEAAFLRVLGAQPSKGDAT